MESSDKERKYRAVANELRDNILSGKYAPGAAFPSVKMLCRRFNVSHLTAVKAIETLKGIGLVRARNGVGTFVRRRMTSIGLVVPMLRQVEIFPPICHEISRICQEKGIAVDFADISVPVPKEVGDRVVATARRMAGSDVSGVIFHPVDFGDGADKANCEVEETFHAAGIPLVLLDSDLDSRSPDRRFDFVGIDNCAIGRNAGLHVIERGAKSIAFVAWESMSANVVFRLEGLLSAMASKHGARLVGKYSWMRDEPKLAELWRRHLPDRVAEEVLVRNAEKERCLSDAFPKRNPRSCGTGPFRAHDALPVLRAHHLLGRAGRRQRSAGPSGMYGLSSHLHLRKSSRPRIDDAVTDYDLPIFRYITLCRRAACCVIIHTRSHVSTWLRPFYHKERP